jgi:hypothetical protein
VGAGVEVGVLVDPVEDVADQLLEEHPRGDPDLTTQVTGDRPGQRGDVGVVGPREDPVPGGGVRGEQVADPPADRHEPVVLEPG